MKPGGSAHTLSTASAGGMRGAMRWAISNGLIRRERASFRGRLVAKSPCSSLCGCSTVTSTAVPGGTNPDVLASCMACSSKSEIKRLVIIADLW